MKSRLRRTHSFTLSHALGQKVAEMLHRNGWSQREFARRFGVSQSSVSHLLLTQRRSQGLAFYERLADLFGLSLSELVGELEARVAAHRHAQVRPRKEAGVVRV